MREVTRNEILKIFSISLIFVCSSFSGCLSSEIEQRIEPESIETEPESLLNPMNRETLFLPYSSKIAEPQQIDYFSSMVEKNRENSKHNYSIPKRGGNWTLYFVCSDGSRITYESNNSGEFYCQSTNETLKGEKFTTSWIAYRHREIIKDFALVSAISYFMTGDENESKIAVDILLQYSQIYPSLPITDKRNHSGDEGGKLTTQSLDEAILLIDFAWVYHLVKPVMNSSEKLAVENNLLVAGLEVLDSPGNLEKNALSNWYTYHNSAKGIIAAATGNISLLNESLFSSGGLLFQIQNGFDLDGFWHEGSLAYHNYTLNAMALHLDSSHYLGVDLYDYNWENRVGNLMHISTPFSAHLQLMKPTGEFPKLNDDINGLDIGDVRELLEYSNLHWNNSIFDFYLDLARSKNIVPSLRSMIWMSSISDSSTNPELNEWTPESKDFNDFGVSIIRKNGVFVLVDYGPHGGWHGHRDKLNIEVSTILGDLISDPGTVPYSLDSSREWYRSTYAHSTMLIGDSEQVEASGYILTSEHNSDFSMLVVGYNDSRFNAFVYRGIVVVPLNDSGLIIFDFIHVELGKSTNISRIFHFSDIFPESSGFSNSSTPPIPDVIDKYTDLKSKNIIHETFHQFDYNLGNNIYSSLWIGDGDELFTGFSESSDLMVLQRSGVVDSSHTFLTFHHIGNVDTTFESQSIQFNRTAHTVIFPIGEKMHQFTWNGSKLEHSI